MYEKALQYLVPMEVHINLSEEDDNENTEVEKDLRDLDGSQRILVRKAIKKVSLNPLPADEGGYGKPLGNHSSTKLAGLLKIKLKASGIRIVYKLIRTESEMLIVVIGVRADDEVYETAQKRAVKNRL